MRKYEGMHQQILLRGDGVKYGSQWWGCKREEDKEYGWNFISQGAAGVYRGVKRTWKDDELTGVLALSLQQKIQMYVIAHSVI